MKVSRYVLATFVFIAALEGFCRLDDYIQWGVGFFSVSSPSNLSVVDDLGKHGRPNAIFQKWRLNSHGFRNDFEVKKAKIAGQKRVFILGASESFGLFESDGMEYPAQLAKLLEEQGYQNLEVINASCAGMSLPDVRIYYEKFISRFQPDLVIYYPSPTFYLDDPPPTVAPGKNTDTGTIFEVRLLAKTRILLKKNLPESLKARRLKWLIGKEIEENRPEWVWHVAPEERLKLFEEDLHDFCDEVQESGSKIILATHASVLGTPDQTFDTQQYLEWRRYYPRAGYYCLLEFEKLSNVIIESVGEDHGLSVLDIDKSIPKTKEYFSDFVHFTDSGSEIFANMAVGVVAVKLDLDRNNSVAESMPRYVDHPNGKMKSKPPG
jgi:hypothetical protein